jgi:hypothetical protein
MAAAARPARCRRTRRATARVGGQVERDAARVDRGGRIRARLLDAVETLLPRMRDAARAGRRRDPCGAGVRRGAGLHAQHAIGVRGRNSVTSTTYFPENRGA